MAGEPGPNVVVVPLVLELDDHDVVDLPGARAARTSFLEPTGEVAEAGVEIPMVRAPMVTSGTKKAVT